MQLLCNIMQKLRTNYANSLRTRRKNYANMFTHTLRTFPMFTQLYFTDITQILRKKLRNYCAYDAFFTQINYADLTQINYAIITQSLRI